MTSSPRVAHLCFCNDRAVQVLIDEYCPSLNISDPLGRLVQAVLIDDECLSSNYVTWSNWRRECTTESASVLYLESIRILAWRSSGSPYGNTSYYVDGACLFMKILCIA